MNREEQRQNDQRVCGTGEEGAEEGAGNIRCGKNIDIPRLGERRNGGTPNDVDLFALGLVWLGSLNDFNQSGPEGHRSLAEYRVNVDVHEIETLHSSEQRQPKVEQQVALPRRCSGEGASEPRAKAIA